MDKEKQDKIRDLCKQYQNKELRVDKFMEALEKEGVSNWICYVISDLHREVSFLTNVGKLDEDDQKVAYKWREEHEQRRKLIDKLGEAERAKDKEGVMAAMKEITTIGGNRCEHDRSIWTPCGACTHIEEVLYPEFAESNDDGDDEDDE